MHMGSCVGNKELWVNLEQHFGLLTPAACHGLYLGVKEVAANVCSRYCTVGNATCTVTDTATYTAMAAQQSVGIER